MLFKGPSARARRAPVLVTASVVVPDLPGDLDLAADLPHGRDVRRGQWRQLAAPHAICAKERERALESRRCGARAATSGGGVTRGNAAEVPGSILGSVTFRFAAWWVGAGFNSQWRHFPFLGLVDWSRVRSPVPTLFVLGLG